MLGKLIKYDLRFVINRGLIIFYALSLAFGGLTRLFSGFDNSLALDIIAKICSGVTISMFFNVIINNLMRLWVRFKTNLYNDESYLTHTLPITKTTHYLSKFLSSLITTLISFGVILLTAFIAYYTNDFWDAVQMLLAPVKAMFGDNIIVYLIILLFLEFFNALQCGFTGIILGHKMNSAKVGLSVIFGLVVYSATQTLVLVSVLVAAIFNRDIWQIFTSADMISPDTAKIILYIALGVYTALIAAGYFLNTKLLKQGVNVD